MDFEESLGGFSVAEVVVGTWETEKLRNCDSWRLANACQKTPVTISSRSGGSVRQDQTSSSAKSCRISLSGLPVSSETG